MLKNSSVATSLAQMSLTKWSRFSGQRTPATCSEGKLTCFWLRLTPLSVPSAAQEANIPDQPARLSSNLPHKRSHHFWSQLRHNMSQLMGQSCQSFPISWPSPPFHHAGCLHHTDKSARSRIGNTLHDGQPQTGSIHAFRQAGAV